MESALHQFARISGQPDPNLREQMAKQICVQFNTGIFSAEELEIVKDILLLLSEDIETRIRAILSSELCRNPHLPRTVALKLAQDVNEVAVPVLEFSTVLTEEDLIQIVHATREVARHSAVARRQTTLTPNVTRTLVSTGNTAVANVLFSNPKAELDDRSIAQAFILFKENDAILEKLIQHGGLSVALAERLIASASATVQRLLAQRFGIANSLAQNVSTDVHAGATLSLLENSGEAMPSKAQELVQHLYHANRLTHSVIMRALCHGELEFFEAGMAKLAGIPLANAKKLMRNGNAQGFQSLYRACNLPEAMLEATEILVRVALEDSPAGGKRELYASRIIQYITEHGYDRTVPNMGYMLALLNDKSRSATALH